MIRSVSKCWHTLASRRRIAMFALLARKAVKFLKQEDGPTAVEYAVMLALIIVVCIVAITTLGSNANQTFANAALKTALNSGS
jgi:pilus assembly protein Flp/PilA